MPEESVIRIPTVFHFVFQEIKNKSLRKNALDKDASKTVDKTSEENAAPPTNVVKKSVVKKSALKTVTRPLYTDSD